MSKMPAKKKSCFQITSVTQAQVAAVGAADDTESLDDPDESRTEDVSSEIYDVSRAEYEPACERSSSDEAVNNVGESEATSNAVGEPRKVAAAAAGSVQSGLPVPTQASTHQPAAASTVSCSSRFRVIKLDHGTGEPFRRGRWTCTEFYEKESEASHAARTDGIRHAGATLDPSADRDSGLGPSVGSTVSTATHSGSVAEGSHASLPQQQQVLLGHSSIGGLQPHPVGQNGLPHSELHIQKSPMMPPPPYPIAGPSSAEYYPQPPPASIPPGQPLPVPGLSVVTGGYIPAPVLPPPAGPGQVDDVVGAAAAAVVGSVSVGQPALAALQQQPQTAGFGVPVLLGGAALPHQPQPIVGHPAPSVVQNVPPVGAGSSPAAGDAVLSASSAAMPNVTASPIPAALGLQGLPAAVFGPGAAGDGRMSEGAVVAAAAQSPVVTGREVVRPLMPESLQLTAPSVTSLFGIHIPVDGEEDRNPSTAFYQAFQSGSRLRDSKARTDSASGANVVAIDNKIEQAMDLVKSHLMYAVREEVEVLKEQIKELFERNSVLERENAVLRSLANSEQLSQLPTQTGAASTITAATPGSASTSAAAAGLQQQLQADTSQPPQQPSVSSA